MKTALAFIVMAIITAAACVAVGYFARGTAAVKKEAKAVAKDQRAVQRKNRASLATGIRTEQAQAATDSFFHTLRTDYETEQHRNPDVGCVLDPVSLRVWNDANAQSDSAAPSQSDGGLSAAATSEAGPERGE